MDPAANLLKLSPTAIGRTCPLDFGNAIVMKLIKEELQLLEPCHMQWMNRRHREGLKSVHCTIAIEDVHIVPS